MNKKYSKEFLITLFILLTVGLGFVFGIYTAFFSYGKRLNTLKKEQSNIENKIAEKTDDIFKTSYKFKNSDYNDNRAVIVDVFYGITECKNCNLRFNYKGELVSKDKILLNRYGEPLTLINASTSGEIKLVLFTEGVEPEIGCDIHHSGTLGCYWYYVGEGKKKNYWKNNK